VERHLVEEAQHDRQRLEVPRDVEVEPAPRKARGVLDAYAVDGPGDASRWRGRKNGGREELKERLQAVEPPRRRAGADRQAAAADIQPIALVRETLCARARELDPGAAPARAAGTKSDTPTCGPEAARRHTARRATHRACQDTLEPGRFGDGVGIGDDDR